MLDTSTGEITGRVEGAPTSTNMRAARPNQPVPEGDAAMGLARNFSWGFNSALFALPDAATQGVGKALGMKEQDVFTLGKFFNKGQVAPRNVAERFTRALGEGVGGGAPFTGIALWGARALPAVKTVSTSKTGVLRGAANEILNFTRQSPGKAAAVDLAFGAAYEGLRQAVTETVPDSDPNKALYEELLPAGAFVGLPVALNLMPSYLLAKKVKQGAEALDRSTSGLTEVSRDVYANDVASGWKLPVINVAPKLLLKRAEQKLGQWFGDINNSPDAQFGKARLEEVLAGPKFAESGFLNNKDGFDFGQITMDPAILREQARLLAEAPPSLRKSRIERDNKNAQRLDLLFESLAPESRQSVMEAFQVAQAEREALFKSILQSQKDLNEVEVMEIASRLGPQNMDMINNELRGALMGAMEFDYKMRDNTLRLMGLRQATSPDGLPMPTRSEGQSLYPARDMEGAATRLIDKYTPERPSLRNPVPEPIAFLRDFVQVQQAARDRLESQMIKDLTDEAVSKQLASLPFPPTADMQEAVRNAALALMRGKQTKGTKRKSSVGEATGLTKAGVTKIPLGGGRFITVNPSQIRGDAALIAADSASININLPEALDYLAAASRFRSDSIAQFNAAMSKGGTRLTDAQTILNRGDAVYNDIEKLILDHVPKIKTEYQGMKNVLADYRAGFEQNLPLLMAQKTGRGDAFLLGNEQLMQRAFSNANDLRQLQVSLAGTPGFDDILAKGTIDWLRTKGVVNEKGLVDPNKIRSVLNKNRNIVEALPDSMQARLQNEVALADDYVRRMGELKDREIAIGDDQLQTTLQKVTRPDADPRSTLLAAVKDPAVMRSLVDRLSQQPEGLNALRRSIWDIATESAQGGGALKTFIDNNEKSLRVLYKNSAHLDDLKKLAELQRRVYAMADVTGGLPNFESLEEGMRRVTGSGIGVVSTTYRSVGEGRLSPETGAIAFTVRMIGALEKNLSDKIFRRAMEDPALAKNMANLSTEAQSIAVMSELEKLGITRSMLSSRADRATRQELSDFALGEEEVPIPGMAEAPVVPRETAASMLRALPPAPPTTGLEQLRIPAKQINNSAPNMQLMYPALFPDDPISGLILQRQQQMRQGQPMQPMQPMPPQQ
jgi:hypothetical protein